MSTLTAPAPTSASGNGSLPTAIIDAVRASLDKTYSAFFSEKPTPIDYVEHHEGPCVAGIISFVGDSSFTFSWILKKETAPHVAQKFCGFEIPFESSDMGDMAGELVNVIAGEIIAQLERRGMKSSMSLPTVARGAPLELIPEMGPSIVNLEYKSKEGGFWMRLAAAKTIGQRLPGR
jgi:chemotaxis protein CheX